MMMMTTTIRLLVKIIMSTERWRKNPVVIMKKELNFNLTLGMLLLNLVVGRPRGFRGNLIKKYLTYCIFHVHIHSTKLMIVCENEIKKSYTPSWQAWKFFVHTICLRFVHGLFMAWTKWKHTVLKNFVWANTCSKGVNKILIQAKLII